MGVSSGGIACRRSIEWIVMWAILLLFMIHVIGDFYPGFFGPLVPHLTDRFGLNQTWIGILQAIFLVIASYSQPFIGLVSERFDRRLLVMAGLVLAAAGMSFLAVAPSFPLLVAGLLVGGLGVALFHPCGAALAGELPSDIRARAIAFFMSGGNFGLALAPMVIPAVLRLGPGHLMWLTLPGILMAALVWAFLKHGRRRPTAVTPLGRLPILASLRKLWGIHLQVVFRFIPLTVYMTFLVKFGKLRRMEDLAAGLSLAMFMLMGGFGAMLGAYLVNRGPRKVLMFSCETVAGICLLIAPAVDGPAFFILLALSSLVAYAIIPLQIALAQERTPGMKGTASGIVMGFAYGSASLALIPLGWLGDYVTKVADSRLIGVTRELQVSALFFFAAAVVALFLRVRADRNETREAVA